MGDAVNKARRFVLDFRRISYGIAEDGSQNEQFAYISKQLRNSIEHLSEGLYGKDIHFILELIQNAEDNPYTGVSPELEFLILEEDPTNTPGSDGCLCIFNNEDGFVEDNVESICGIGQSTKDKRQGYIGEKGIGFKSVFSVSAQPHIYSNGFRFCFKEKDPSIELAFIVPYWLESSPSIVQERKINTAILLPLKPGMRAEIIAELERIRPETILFLSKLEGLSVDVREKGERIDLIRDAKNLPIVDLLVQHNGQQDRIDQYWLHERTVPVPDDIKEPKREGVGERTLAVAFPLDSNDHRGRIFAFLPTEVESGLPFILNADFILAASRESIQKGKPWNTWIREPLAELVSEGIEAMLANKTSRIKAYGFIPLLLRLQNLREYFGPLCTSVCNTLSSKAIVLTDTGKMVVPERARLARKVVRHLFKGGKRPAAFSDFDFVDPELETWAPQLKVVGVGTFTIDELAQCLQDKSWLLKRRPDWFLELYRYLHEANQQQEFVADLPVVLLDGDGVASPADGPVYYPGPREPVAKLRKTLKAGGFPDVTFVHPKVLEGLREDAGLMQWAGEVLDLTEFSVRKFLLGTLLPWAYQNAGELEPEQAFKLAQIVVDHWDRLDEEDADELKEKLPVVLNNGTVRVHDELGGEELLVPRTLDSDKGWQLILVAGEDYAHEDVLADGYTKLRGGIEAIEKLLTAVGAQTFPDLKNDVFYQSDADSTTPHGVYVQAQLPTFPSDWTRRPRLESWMAPSFFYKKKTRESRKHRLALIHWLEGMLENRSKILRNGTIGWYYRTDYSRVVESGLRFELERQPWVRTTKGLKRPAEVFVESKQLREMFGARLPYLKDEMSPALIEFLDIHTEATTEAIIDYLRVLADDSTSDTGLVNKLYNYLDEYGKGLKDPFSESPLIFVPDSPKLWYRSGEVVWEDLSNVFGDLYVYLSPAYESKALDRFFTKTIGVSRTVGVEELARAWKQLAEKEAPDPEAVGAALARIMPVVLQEARSEDEHPEWWEEFVEEIQVWTYGNQFVQPGNALAGDDAQLRKLFEGSVSFVWMPDSLTHDRLEPLYRALGVHRLSGVVRVTLDSPRGVSEVEVQSILTPHSRLLLAYLVHNQSPERFEELMANDVLPRLMQAAEFSCEDLVLKFSLEGFFINRTDNERCAFWDGENCRLYLRAEADHEDLLDEAAEGIARIIWGRQFRDHEDAVRRTLAVGTKERFKKLHDKKGWHLPREELTRINQLIGAPRPETKGTETEPEPEQVKTPDQDATSTGTEVGTPSVGRGTGTSAVVGQGGARSGRGGGVSGTRSGGHTRSGSGRARASGAGSYRSRSKQTSAKIRAANQSRIPVYVYRDSSPEKREESPEKQQRREAIGEAAEDYVYRKEQEKGQKAKRMPAGNPGYDIEVIDQHTGELRFIEVKGQDGEWGARGVGLSDTQFKMAIEKGAAYWLYIVEQARSGQPKITKIQNPFRCITEYRFDSSWAQLAVHKDHVPLGDIPDRDALVKELKTYTDDEVCREIIDNCHQKSLELPEVGYEVINEDSAVIGEVELAWPDFQIAVRLPEQREAEQVLESEEWLIFSVENVPDNNTEFELYGLLTGSDEPDDSL